MDFIKKHKITSAIIANKSYLLRHLYLIQYEHESPL